MRLIDGVYLVSSEGIDFAPCQASSNCGSTSVAQWLVDNKKAVKVSLAAPGRSILKSLDVDGGLDPTGDEPPSTKLTLVNALQGSRRRYPSLWVLLSLVDIHQQISHSLIAGKYPPLFIIDDVRDPIDSLILRGSGMFGYEVIREEGGICYPSDGMNRGMTDSDNSGVLQRLPFGEADEIIEATALDVWQWSVFHSKHLDRYSSDSSTNPQSLHHIYNGLYHAVAELSDSINLKGRYYSPSRSIKDALHGGDDYEYIRGLCVAYSVLYTELMRVATTSIASLLPYRMV